MSKLIKIISFTALVIFICGTISFAQKTNKPLFVSGYIIASGSQEQLAGVNVYLKGSTTGTITNANGYYSLKVWEGELVIVFSYIGYQTLEKAVNIKNSLEMNIILELNQEKLPEISVTAQRKFFGNMDYGRDIPTIKSIDIEKMNSTNASDILHARIAGVWATKTSGAPGDQQKIRVRGQASFFSSSEPLYVIDGVPVPIVNLSSLGIGDLNIHDIESVTILKDASSTALYGYQGSNGVILIDTKQRSENKLDFSYRNGMEWFDNRYDLMNSKDFLTSLDVASQTIKSLIYKYYPKFSDSLCSHNRQGEIFQRGKVQEYQLSGGGSILKLNYYLSGNYNKHTGIIKRSEQDKYNFTARLGTTLKNKMVINGSYRTSYQENNNNQNEYLGNNLIFEGVNKAPCLECTPDSLLWDKSGSYPILYNRNNVNYALFNDTINTREIKDNNSIHYNYFSHAVSLMARYNISSNINLDVIESAMLRNSNFSIYSGYNIISYNSWINSYGYRSLTANLKSKERIALLNHQINLTYSKIIQNHEINVSFAHRYYADNVWWEVDSLKQSIPSGFYLKNSMIGNAKKGSVIREMGSYITHLSYNFRKTYFISAIANISRVQEGIHIDYFTIFPSVSINWDISKIKLFKNSPWINEFNIYANYGSSGNYPLNGLANDVYDKTLYKTTYNHLILTQLSNHYLKHESNTEFNIGIKSSFLNYKLKLNAASYLKSVGNQIILRDIPYYYIGGKMYVNLGDIDVKGCELGFEAYPIENQDFNWSIAGNISTSKQSVRLLADHKDIQFISDDLLFPDFVIKEGQKLGDIYGYECLGKWTDQDKKANDINYFYLGGYKFRNTDTTDLKLNEKDKKVIGNSIPKFNWNLMSSFRYKSFGLDLVVYSVWGVQKYNATRAGTYITGVNKDLNNFYADSSIIIRSFIFYQSSYFIEDASFIRLKTLSFIYEPKRKLLGVNCKFSLSFENLLTITNYKGYDPEASIYTDNNFSDNAVDRGAYPNPKSVYITIGLNF